MTVEEAAKKLGMRAQTLRLALQQGCFDFGRAIVTTKAENSKVGKDRYTYYINEVGLDEYLRGGKYEKKDNSGVVNNCIVADTVQTART